MRPITATMWFLQCSNYCILLHQCRIIGDNVYKMCPDVQNVAVLEENFHSCTYMHLVSYSYVLTVFCCRQQESVALVSQKMPAILLYVPHTHTQPFNGRWSGTTRVGRYQMKHSPTHTHPDHRTSFINFLLYARCPILIISGRNVTCGNRF